MKTSNKSIYVIIILFLSLSFSKIFAQEKQVPFFPEQDIFTIEKNYAKKMDLYREYENFIEARLYKTIEKRYALEIFYEKDAFIYKDRREMSETEKNQYLESLVAQYASGASQDPSADSDTITTLLNQRGRPAMLITNTITGLGFYGYALPLTFNIQEEKAFVGLYMLAAGASFYIPYRITQYQDVTLGQASLTFYGQSRGIMHGIFLGELLKKRPRFDDYMNSQDYYRASDRHAQFLFGMGIATSVGGGIAGYKLADRWAYSGGSTSIFQMWGDIGTISGLLASNVAGLWENSEPDAIFGTALLTSAAGMVVGKYFGDTRNYTLGDAIVYRSNLALASLIPITLVNYFEPDEEEAYTAAALFGLAIGSYTGWKQTQGKDFGTSEAVFIALGEIAGGLLGAGLGYLIAPSTSADKIILTGASLGAFSGYALMYGQFSKKALKLSTNLDIDFNLNPIGLFMNPKKPLQPELMSMYNLANLKIRF